MTKFLQQELIFQGVDWLKSQRTELFCLCANELIRNTRPYNQISDTLFLRIAAHSIDFIIAQVENPLIASSGSFFAGLEDKAASTQHVITAVEIMQSIAVNKIKLELADQPQLRKFLIEKINYTVYLFKADLAAVIVSQQAAQYAN